MTDSHPTIHDIVAQLKILTDKLKRTTDENHRRALLKQFRLLLDQADTAVRGVPPAE
jgi:methionyl-tRNA synthetase